METKDFRIRLVSWVCWAFFGLCVAAICRWGILKFVSWADWGVPDWAAWVQAIGSIVAIGVAFSVANSQSRAEDRRRNEGDIRRLGAIKAISAQLLSALSMVDDERQKAFRISHPLTIEFLRDPAKQISTLPIFDIPAATLIIHCTSMQRLTHELVEALLADIDATNNARMVEHAPGDTTDDRYRKLWDECINTIGICEAEIRARN